MQLDSKMDAGPIYTQTRQTLTGKETKFELYDKLFHEWHLSANKKLAKHHQWKSSTNTAGQFSSFILPIIKQG